MVTSLDVDKVKELEGLLQKYTQNKPHSKTWKAKHNSCLAKCEMIQVLRCRIDGKVNNSNAYYDGFCEGNKNDELWVFITRWSIN